MIAMSAALVRLTSWSRATGSSAGFILLGLVCASQPVWAQAIPYTFTRIADTNDDAGLEGPYCVGMNNLGTVIVNFVPTGSSYLQLWRGDGQAFTQVEPVAGSVCSSINDLGETAYVTYDPNSPNPAFLVRNSNGVLTTLASTHTDPFLQGTTYLPSLSFSGSAVFQGGTYLNGIYVGPSGPTVYNPETDPPFGFAVAGTMNDSLVVAFVASRPDPSAPSGQRVGIYRGSLTPLIEDGDPVSGGTIGIGLERPVINNSGTVAFTGSTDGSPTVYTTSDGLSVSVVGSGQPQPDRIAINDSGTVAFRRASSISSGIFTGRPGSINETVIAAGDPIDGSTLQNAFLWEEAINNRGQVAFWAQLADGREGVYRADPPSSCATDISATVAVGSQGPLKLNRNTGLHTQKVTLKNGDGAVSGPVSLVLDNLSTNASLFNATGTTGCAAPLGGPYISVDVGADFSLRERAIVTLEFTNPSGQAITYTPRVLAGPGDR